jgi:hypothetical protein
MRRKNDPALNTWSSVNFSVGKKAKDFPELEFRRPIGEGKLSGCMEICSWADLANKIMAMPEDQKGMPAQIVVHGPNDDVAECLPVVAFGDVDSMGFYGCRSIVDNRYHGDEFVILTDHSNGFGKDGAVAYELGDFNGDEDQGFFDDSKPIYGKHGKTLPEEQLNPKRDEDTTDGEFSPAEIAIIRARVSEIREDPGNEKQ